MAWKNNGERNGIYTVLKPFEVHHSRIVGICKPKASFDVQDTIRIGYTGESSYEGPIFTLEKLVTDRASVDVNQRGLEDLIEAKVLKKL